MAAWTGTSSADPWKDESGEGHHRSNTDPGLR
jgi:hypothetical protein